MFQLQSLYSVKWYDNVNDKMESVWNP